MKYDDDLLLNLRNGGPAFPITGPDETWEETGGMSLRDWFAGQAIDRMISLCQDRDGGWDVHAVAAGAYQLADALLEARKS